MSYTENDEISTVIYKPTDYQIPKIESTINIVRSDQRPKRPCFTPKTIFFNKTERDQIRSVTTFGVSS